MSGVHGRTFAYQRLFLLSLRGREPPEKEPKDPSSACDEAGRLTNAPPARNALRRMWVCRCSNCNRLAEAAGGESEAGETCPLARREHTMVVNETAVRTAIPANPLSEDELRRLDMWFRAANYLSVGQIYLMDNP